MKILALPNALKGSLSARKAGQIFEHVLSKHHILRTYPVSDGGDGFLDFFQKLDPQAQKISLTVKNAFLQSKRTFLLLLSDGKTAIIETAKICGLGNTKPTELDPLGASSYGVGQAISAAVEHGAKVIYIGLGGVACNDGGAGMAAACGMQLLDKKNRPLALGAKPLLQLHTINLRVLKKRFRGIKIIGIADVTNPLLGPLGSARVFGPQKGASPKQVHLLERALSSWNDCIKNETGKDMARLPSAGAAGAIAAGLYGCFGAQLLLGTQKLFEKIHLVKQIRWADLILTCEGKLDKQTFYGKAPGTLLTLAHKYHKPVLFICGQLDGAIFRTAHPLPRQIVVLSDFAPTIQEAQTHAATYIRRALKQLL